MYPTDHSNSTLLILVLVVILSFGAVGKFLYSVCSAASLAEQSRSSVESEQDQRAFLMIGVNRCKNEAMHFPSLSSRDRGHAFDRCQNLISDVRSYREYLSEMAAISYGERQRGYLGLTADASRMESELWRAIGLMQQQSDVAEPTVTFDECIRSGMSHVSSTNEHLPEFAQRLQDVCHGGHGEELSDCIRTCSEGCETWMENAGESCALRCAGVY